METIASGDGVAIAFQRTGHGPPLVLVHGTGRDRRQWGRCTAALGRHATVYAIDRRGRGESGDVERHTLAAETADVVAVLGALGEPAHLLGHSYGAIVALEAATRVETLRGLILYEPPLAGGG